MRLLGAMCVKNEADRYLAPMLQWHSTFLDGIHVYDDQSDDATVAVAERYGAMVDVRPNDVPPFMDHEGQFREAAWEALELTLQPLPGDWILALDADEFFVAQGEPERAALERLVTLARISDANACRLRIDEIFDIYGGVPRMRVDGFWNDISAPRFFQYQVRGHFANRRMGCGSTPTYVVPADMRAYHFGIQHYGYATGADRAAKYHRYTNQTNNGHNSVHIESILAVPVLNYIEGGRWPAL